jgi:Immunity protein 27
MPLPDETEVTEQTRIQQLIRDELVKIARDLSGWRVLYRDPKDGRLWQLSYPQSEMHGGGPAKLSWISSQVAKTVFGPIEDPSSAVKVH